MVARSPPRATASAAARPSRCRCRLPPPSALRSTHRVPSMTPPCRALPCCWWMISSEPVGWDAGCSRREAGELGRRLLEQAGARVVTATSAAEALQSLGAHSPTVLVSDIGMPDEDGYGLIRSIRQPPHASAIPAIALTAFARDAERQQ